MKPFGPRTSSNTLTHVQLAARETRQFVNLEGQRITCLEGTLWITQHHDSRDIVLTAGQSFVLDRPGLAVAFALQDTLLTLGPVPEDLAA
ncbi:MAG: DUF2917 domain-containing protein [Hyphomicrobiaceae bacterium]|nr:DUF2917 domain-containing protein [Hyphomicrobiaceae bacterium]